MIFKVKQSNHRQSKVIQVIKTTAHEGEGTAESIGREVVYYTELNGRPLFKLDPYPGGKEPVKK